MQIFLFFVIANMIFGLSPQKNGFNLRDWKRICGGSWVSLNHMPTQFGRLRLPAYLGIDLGCEQIEIASRRYPDLQFACGTAYELPSPATLFDLCVACEVLEHLDHPQRAIQEMRRVTNGFVLISVPWEPMWRVLNVLRGRYLKHCGNTPGHIQHFTRYKLRRLVQMEFSIAKELHPFPWTMLLCKARHPAPKISPS